MEGGLGPEPGAEWLGQAVAGERPGKDPEERVPDPLRAPSSAALTWCGPSGAPRMKAQEATVSPVSVSTHSPTPCPRGARSQRCRGWLSPSCLLQHAWEDSRVPGWSPSEARPPGGRLTPHWAAQQGPGLTGRWEQRERSVVSQGPSHHRAAIPSDPGPHARGRSEAPGELQESRQPRWRQKRFHAQLLPAAGTDKETLQSLRAPSTTSAG